MKKLILFILTGLLLGFKGYTQQKIIDELDAFQQEALADPVAYLDQFSRFRKKDAAPLMLAYSHKVEGVLHYYLGNNQKALDQYEIALKCYASSDSKLGLPSVYNNMAVVLYDLNLDEAAVDNYNKCIYAAFKQKDLKNLAIAHSNLANIYIKTGLKQKALKHAKKGCYYAQKIHIPGILFNNYNILGAAYNDNARFTEALKTYRSNLTLANQSNDPIQVGTCLVNIGNTYNHLFVADSAIWYLQQGAVLFELNQHQFGLCQVYNALGNAYIRLKKYEEAVPYLEKALTRSREIHHIENEYFNCDALAYVYEKLNKPVKALEYLKLSKSLNDSLRSAEINSRMLQNEAYYRDQEKEFRIKSLKKQKLLEQEKASNRSLWIVIISALLVVVILLSLYVVSVFRVNAQRKNDLAEKQQLETEYRLLRAQLNPHFIFNALNSVNQLLLTGKNDKASEMLVNFSQYIRNLLNQTTSDLVLLSDELKQIEAYLHIEMARFPSRFSYEVILQDGLLADELRIPTMILQPIVENALIHGILPLKDNQGALKINISDAGNDCLKISVKDNGVGFDPNKNSGHLSLSTSLNTQRILSLNPTIPKPYTITRLETGTLVELFIPYKAEF